MCVFQQKQVYMSSYVFLQQQSFSWHFSIFGRDMGGGVSISFANSILCFSKCFSYSFESNAFFGWRDISLYVCIPTCVFYISLFRSRIPILVVLEFSRETACSVPRQDLCVLQDALYYLYVFPQTTFYMCFPTKQVYIHSSYLSKRQSFCWYFSYIRVCRCKKTCGRYFCTFVHNIGIQYFPIDCERYVVRIFFLQSLSNPFLQTRLHLYTFARVVPYLLPVFLHILCSGGRRLGSCSDCKTNIEDRAYH